jgi:hypothetical protein
MAGSQRRQAIPAKLSLVHFEAFVLPHLSVGNRGPAPKLSLHRIFNYILCVFYLGRHWTALPIEKDRQGRPEIHYARVYRAFPGMRGGWLYRRHFRRLGAQTS